MKIERPAFWDDSREVTEFFNALSAKVQDLQKAVRKMREELFVTTASGSLQRHAEMYGVPKSDGTEAMREEILGKIRGVGVCNAEKLKKLAVAHGCGEIAIEEVTAEYTVRITFVSAIGVPKNMAAFEKAIRDAVPAHLAIEFVYTYRKWNEYSGYTWESLAENIWQEVLEKEELHAVQ